jgi:hypothetical protein
MFNLVYKNIYHLTASNQVFTLTPKIEVATPYNIEEHLTNMLSAKCYFEAELNINDVVVKKLAQRKYAKGIISFHKTHISILTLKGKNKWEGTIIEEVIDLPQNVEDIFDMPICTAKQVFVRPNQYLVESFVYLNKQVQETTNNFKITSSYETQENMVSATGITYQRTFTHSPISIAVDQLEGSEPKQWLLDNHYKL